MANCEHIIGYAWILNPDEGAAWIHRFVNLHDIGLHSIRPDDFITVFKHCPCCGELLTHNHADIDDIEFIMLKPH